MTFPISTILMLRTPFLVTSSSSRMSISSTLSSSSSSYKGKHWNHPRREIQNIMYQFLSIEDQAVAGQLNRAWREDTLYMWDITTRNHRFSWREANHHPRLNYLLTKALINIVFQMKEERGKDYGLIASSLKDKYQKLMDIVPSFRCYAMIRFNPHLGSKIVRSLEEFNETDAAEKTIYKKSQDLAATGDALLYVLMEIEKGSEKLAELLDLVLRVIDNGLTYASLLMTQKSHVWPIEMLEKMAIASLKKGDYDALEMIVQTYSKDDLQRLQSENPGLVLPPVLYRLALQEDDLHKQDVALEAAIEAYETYSRRSVSSEVLCDAANTKFRLGYHTEANNLFTKAMRECGAKVPPFILFRVANFKCKIQQYEEAHSLFMQIITEDPDNASGLVLYHFAYTKLKLERYEESIEYFARAIRKYRETDEDGAPPLVLVDAAYALQRFVFHRNKTTSDSRIYYNIADEYYIEAIKKYGDKVPYRVLMAAARLKYHLQEYEKADELYSRFMATCEGEIPVKNLNEVADVKLSLGKHREVVTLYTQVINRLKNEVSAVILANMAYSKLKLKHYEEAVNFYKQAIEKYGDEVPAVVLANMACVKLNLKQYEDAVQFYKQAIQKYENEIPAGLQEIANYAQSKLIEI